MEVGEDVLALDLVGSELDLAERVVLILCIDEMSVAYPSLEHDNMWWHKKRVLAFCRSARETSKILPFRASLAFLRPVVRLTRVFPTLSVHNISLLFRCPCLNAKMLQKVYCAYVCVGLCVLSDAEGGWCLDRIPVLLRERVGSLLEALLALGKALVLSYRHDV